MANSALDAVSGLLKDKEGFSPSAYWDVNHYRVGYGSDTWTDDSGKVHTVTKDTVVTPAQAERDLQRRITETQQQGIIPHVGQAAWDSLSVGAKAAVTSLAYNYGSLDGLPSIVKAVKSGDAQAIAGAIAARGKDNDGINASRRQDEAAFALRPPAGIGMTGASVGQGAGALSPYNVPLPIPRPNIGSMSAAGMPMAQPGVGQATMNGTSLPRPRPSPPMGIPGLQSLPSDAMYGQNRLVPGHRTNPPTDFAQNTGQPMSGQMSSMLGPQSGSPGGTMSASGSSGGPLPMTGNVSMTSPGAMSVSGISPRAQVPASVSLTAPPSLSGSKPITPKSASWRDPPRISSFPTTSGFAGTVQMGALRPSSVPVPQTDFQMLGNGPSSTPAPINIPQVPIPTTTPPRTGSMGGLSGMGGLMGAAGAGTGYQPTGGGLPMPPPPNLLPNGMPIDSSVPLNSPSRMAYAQQPAPTYHPRVTQPTMVTLASGKTVPVGTTGTAENGHYTFTVQPDGSITKVTNPLTKQQRSDRFTNLDQFGMIK